VTYDRAVRRLGALVAFACLVLAAAPGAALGVGFTEFKVSPGSGPRGIVAGPDGNLWFTEEFGARIGRITPAGNLTEFAVPTGGSAPENITVGPDSNLWFTERDANKVGRITTAGLIQEFGAGISPGSQPRGIASGADGALWFTEFAGNRIGRMTVTGVVTNEFALPVANSNPLGITAGPDGALWFTEPPRDVIGRISTAGAITEFDGPSNLSGPETITSGPDGNLWFVEDDGDRVGRMTTGGATAEFPIAAGSQAYYIGNGPDGNLWFTEHLGARLGRVTPAGKVTEFDLPKDARPMGVTTGPDGAIWFADQGRHSIWRAVREAPFVVPGVASAISQTAAAVGGRVDPRAEATSARFEYGTTTAYGASTPPQSAGDGTGAVDVSSVVSGLSASTTYHFRLVATSPAGTTVGPDQTFTTAAFPPTLINATIDPVFSLLRNGRTRIKRLVVAGIPSGGRVEVRCTGRGCPKRFTRRNVRRVNLASRFRRRQLRAGVKLDIRVLADGRIGKVFEYTIRRRRSPRLRLRCQPPAATRPQACD
jgi:streptogramin lyase